MIAEYIPEEIDKTQELTVVRTYCNGRTTVDYPEKVSKAVIQYIRHVRMGLQTEDMSKVITEPGEESPPVHIRMVTYLRRDRAGDIKHHIDSGVMECDCG